MIVKDSKDGLYRETFIRRIDEIKHLYQSGNTQRALNELKTLFQNQEILVAEEALRDNLIGVIYFSKNNFKEASRYFKQAASLSHRDGHLTAQVHLNLASSYYKLNDVKSSYGAITAVGGDVLKGEEYRKYYRLRYVLAKELGRQDDAARSLIVYFKHEKMIIDLKSDPLFEALLERFSQLEDSQKLNLLDEFSDEGPLVAGFLGHLEAEKLYYAGNSDDAMDILRWLQTYYSGHRDIAQLVETFVFRLENYTKIDPRAVGVVLPLTGSRAVFGRRALLGIDSALKHINSSLPLNKKIGILIRDSKDSGVVGARRVKDLVENHFVSVVIGGLSPGTATREYLEARKLGVFYLSLSQVYTPREQKNHLLLEIPGSVESQMEELFSKDALRMFGRRAAIVYPKGEQGEAYVKEFWRRAKLENLDVTGLVSFREKENDYREPIRNILGLSFIRGRKEEYDILNEIHSLEKSGSIRRVQTLRPQVDFDWVFIPSLPKETVQIVPAFSYFDAFNLNIIGIPSWRTQTIVRENSKLGRLHFIGDDMGIKGRQYRKDFIKTYKRRPRVVEFRSFDALSLAASFIGNKDYETRGKLDQDIRFKKELVGLTGKWVFDDGIWIKRMNTLRILNGKIETLF